MSGLDAHHHYDVGGYYEYLDDYSAPHQTEAFEPWEYSDMFRPRLIRELQRQHVAHESPIRLRLYLYSNIDGHASHGEVELFCIKYPALLRQAIAEGRVEVFPDHQDWIMLPGTLNPARELYPERAAVYRRWKELAGTQKVGHHLEELIRRSLRRAGYKVASKPIRVGWNNHTLELDVVTFGPLKLAIEAKNKFSDVYYSPDVLSPNRINEDLQQIRNVFEFCSANNMIPVLAASLVDRTFYSFQHRYSGLHCCIKFQVFPPGSSWQGICEAVRQHFRLGNLQVWDEPPPHMQRWFDSIPAYYQRAYGPAS